MTITSLDEVTEYPLTWPPGKERTARRQAAKFKTTHARAAAHLEEQMKRAGFTPFVVSMAPRYRSGPVDPGVAVWFYARPRPGERKRELRVLACDRFLTIEDNLRAIGLTVEALRAMERYGTYTVDQAVEGARIALPPPARDPDWWEVLKVGRDWPLVAIEAVYREAAKGAHPDQGGDPERFKQLNAAIEAARKEKDNG